MAALQQVDCTVFVDGDHSVCAHELDSLLNAWHEGAQLVIGSRTLGDMQPGALTSLNMQERTFGWTVEMQAKALSAGLRMTEVPVTSLKRIGTSKVSGTWRGSVGAGVGILSTIAKIAAQSLRERRAYRSAQTHESSLPADT